MTLWWENCSINIIWINQVIKMDTKPAILPISHNFSNMKDSSFYLAWSRHLQFGPERPWRDFKNKEFCQRAPSRIFGIVADFKAIWASRVQCTMYILLYKCMIWQKKFCIGHPIRKHLSSQRASLCILIVQNHIAMYVCFTSGTFCASPLLRTVAM